MYLVARFFPDLYKVVDEYADKHAADDVGAKDNPADKKTPSGKLARHLYVTTRRELG